MDPKEREAPGAKTARRTTGLGRRSYLGLAATAAAFGSAGWLSRWVGKPADVADRSFARQAVWHETLPTSDWDDANQLPLHHESFETGLSNGGEWRRDLIEGTPHELTADNDHLLVQNAGNERAVESIATSVDIDAPWVAVAASVTALSESSAAAAGFSKDDENAVLVGVSPDGPELGYQFGRAEVSFPGQGDAPSPPFDLLAVLMGDRLSHLTREPGEPWVYHGHVGWRGQRVGVDLFDRDEWARWNPTLGVETGPDARVAISDLRVFHTLQFGIRDPTVVTYPDGTPMVRDGELFLTVTCGSVDHRGYQAVIGLDLETYDVTMRAALWAESIPDYVSNYVASHLMYDPDREEFRQCWSGFGNGPQEPYWNQKCWVSRSDRDLLSGTHVLECELMHLPWGFSGRQHDPFVIWDEETGTWRCIHTSEAIHRITVSETTDETWTDGWRPIASYRDVVHQIEGGKLARIDGEIVLSYADQGSRNHMVTAAYPDPSAGRRWIDVDIPPSDVAPHPSLVAVPTEAGTKYLLITMDGETVYGIGEPSHGGLVIYEAAGGPTS